MNRLVPRKIVKIPAEDPVIAYKRLTKDMRSPYRHHLYEIGETYHCDCLNGNYLIEGFYTTHESRTNTWGGELLFKVAIWGRIMFINESNIESEYLKILEKVDSRG